MRIIHGSSQASRKPPWTHHRHCARVETIVPDLLSAIGVARALGCVRLWAQPAAVLPKKWRRRMGIEPTRDPCGPHTDFEDQGRHQTPVTSGIAFLRAKLPFSLGSAMLFVVGCTPVSYTRWPIFPETSVWPSPNLPAHKPRPDFPWFPHTAGHWAKKAKGRLHYFVHLCR